LIQYNPSDPVEGRYAVRIERLAELSEECPADHELLRVKIPANTRIQDGEKPRNHYRTSREEYLTPGDISEVLEKLADAEKNPRHPRSAEPLPDLSIHPATPSSYVRYWWAAAVVAVLGIAYFFSRRKKT
jgi:hypothetical protein